MFLSVLSVVLMALMFLYMFNKAHFAKTRRMALIPLGCAVIELFATGMLTPELFPVLTAVLILLRGTILVSCFFALRQDALDYARRKRKVVARTSSALRRIPYSNNVSGHCA
jgi:hypothetical protein